MKRSERLNVKYSFGGVVIYEPEEVFGPRLLTDFEAVLIIEGFPNYKNNNGLQPLKPGSILVAQPGVVETYYWDARQKTRHAYLHFDIESIPHDWPNPAVWPTFQLAPSKLLIQLLQHVINMAPKPYSDALKPSLSHNRLLESFLELYIEEDANLEEQDLQLLSDPVRRAVNFMREKLAHPPFDNVTLDELAKSANVSSKHLCRIFKKELGITPMKAYRMMQFHLAIPLLSRSNLSIKEISVRCGFQDPLYFTRKFADFFGQPPTQVRKAIKNGTPPPIIALPHQLIPKIHA